MTPDLLAAAERLRRIKRGESCEDVYYGFASLAGQHLLDYTTVGDALTDETPIDEAWLRSVGFVQEEHPIKWTLWRPAALSVGLWHVDDGWKAMLIHHQHAASCIRRGLTTRGSVTALLFALGATK